MFRKGPHVCPECGERVTAFAAGCAICGAELDPQRALRRGSLQSRLGAGQIRSRVSRLFERGSRVRRP
jgi:predicted amidophosphoribosyltransferase